MEYDFTVNEELSGLRIDKCISEYFEEFSRSYVQKLIDDGNVHCNGLPCKSKTKVNFGDRISLSVPNPVVPEIVPENIPIDIIYEDDDLIIINKPKGMVVHPAPGHYSGTMVNALMFHCKDQLSGINGILRPGIVHRIDMNTTGSVIACKNDFAHNNIALQLKEHSVNRHYLAICHGNFNETEGTVDAPIGRSDKDRKKMCINYSNGKRAVTHYSVIKQYKGFALVDCQLETGRTHQIRVHMASINHPILGDDVYCNIKSQFKLNGQCLHAYILGFNHPRTGEYIETKAPIPEYFEHLTSVLESL